MERRARWLTPLVALVLAAGSIGPALANPETLEKARRLLNENNPKQAYMELIPLEGTLAGNIDYDYLLGVAALDSGKYEDAIIAFERVLAVNPEPRRRADGPRARLFRRRLLRPRRGGLPPAGREPTRRPPRSRPSAATSRPSRPAGARPRRAGPGTRN